MKGVRFTKAELAVVQAALEMYENQRPAEAKYTRGALTKLELAELPVKSKGIAVTEALAAFREVLGPRLIPPPSGAQGVYVQMTRRLAALGFSRMDCVSIAKTAGAQWQGRIKAESLVRQADALMADSQGIIPGTGPRTPRAVAPVELGDDDI